MELGKDAFFSIFFRTLLFFANFRYFDKVLTERNNLLHDREGLLSMEIKDQTTSFFITLGKIQYIFISK